MTNNSNISKVRAVPASTFATDRFTVGPNDQPVQLISADPNRRDVTVLTDDDSDGILWLTDRQVKNGGIRVRAGGGYVFTHGAPVYAYSTGGDVRGVIVNESGEVCS